MSEALATQAPQQKGFLANLVQSLWSSVGSSTIGRAPHETYPGSWQENADHNQHRAKKNALSHSAVYTCINSITSDFAKLPPRVMRPRDGGGGREVHASHPLTRLLKKPNRYQTSLQFLQHYLSSKLWTGNAYVLLFRDARGVVDSMHVLDPMSVTPSITSEGEVWYHIKASVLHGIAEDTYIPQRNIIHDRGVTLFHPLIGVSPLYAAAVSAGIGNSISANSEIFFDNMSRASGTLTAPGEIPPTTATRLKREWDGNYTGLGFGKVAVLGSGLTWTPLTMTAVDAQLIEQLRWTVEDIGRVYRVPGFMLGDTKITYRNSEQAARYYFQGCLSYHIEAAEQCMEQKFELSGGTEIKFDLSPLFRMETDLRYETHAKALNSGIKSIDEVRGEEDLPPVKGGKEPRLQMQYVPLSMIDQLVAQNGTPKPGAPAAPAPPAPDPTPAPAEEPVEEATDELIQIVKARMLTYATQTAGA